MLKSSGRALDNGFLEVYVNARSDDGSDIAKMMRIFTQDEAYDYERFPELSKRKEQYKKTKEGFRTMCDFVEENFAKWNADDVAAAEARGVAKGKIESATDFVISLINDKLPINFIIKHTSMTLDAIRSIAQRNNLQLVE